MENKTAQQIAGGIPCACSDCGMNEVAGTKMIQEYAKQELSAYNVRLKEYLTKRMSECDPLFQIVYYDVINNIDTL